MIENCHLVGCGILKKEVGFLIEKNHWPVKTHFLNSALHNYLERLDKSLNKVLEVHKQKDHRTLIFYGACHPNMAKFEEKHDAQRIRGQNCIVMLIGHDKFMELLSLGAYFLLEQWALTWEPMIKEAFGENLQIIRDIFKSCHLRMIAIRTPCSDDFQEAAQAAADFVDLPLEWMDVNLDHLESIIAEAIEEQK